MNEELKCYGYLLKPIDFIIRNNQIVGFRDLSFKKKIEKGIIQEVIIGPSCKAKEDDIKYLLVKNGFDSDYINIIKSDASYQIK